MRYGLDTEFIDTQAHSHLVSIGIAAEDGRRLYCELRPPLGWSWDQLWTPWLRENVAPHLDGDGLVSGAEAANMAAMMFHGDRDPVVWCYYGAYDWYHFCRLFGGWDGMPWDVPRRFRELDDLQHGCPAVSGFPPHHALGDAIDVLEAVLALGDRTRSMRL